MLAREIWACNATLSVAASESPPQRASGLWLRVLHLWIALVSPLESLGLPCPDMSIFRTDNWAGSPIGGLPFPFYCPGENQETWVCFYSELTEYKHTSASSLCSSGRGVLLVSELPFHWEGVGELMHSCLESALESLAMPRVLLD